MLPENVHGASLLTSPNGRSVILIGGCTSRFNPSNKLYELSGNSTSNLKWRVMDQALVYPRSSHLSHYLGYEAVQEYSTHGISKHPSNTKQSFFELFKKCLKFIGEKYDSFEVQGLLFLFCFLVYSISLFSLAFSPNILTDSWMKNTLRIGYILFISIIVKSMLSFILSLEVIG